MAKKRGPVPNKPESTDRHHRKSFPLRLPPKVREYLERKAKNEFRDLTKEILLALKKHIEDTGGVWDDTDS